MSASRPRLAGVIGWPISHSLSPVLHTHWLKEYGIAGAYIPIGVSPADFAQCVEGLARAGFAGVNATIPHKQAAFALASTHDEAAHATGAVNTLVFAEGAIRGLNTDVHGFAVSFKEVFGKDAARAGPAVVLGAGGGARAAVLALARAGAPEIRLLNRTRDHAETLSASLKTAPFQVMEWAERSEALAGARTLVNATSLGMAGGPELDISLDKLAKDAVVADIVYNPSVTNLLRNAQARGHKTMNGLGMLMHQAAPAFSAWFGVAPRVTPELRAILERALLRG